MDDFAERIVEIVIEVAVPNQRGNENSWVRVQTDGNVAFEGIMRAGEKLVFEAQRRVVIRAGNPPDVFVTVNGRSPSGENVVTHSTTTPSAGATSWARG